MLQAKEDLPAILREGPFYFTKNRWCFDSFPRSQHQRFYYCKKVEFHAVAYVILFLDKKMTYMHGCAIIVKGDDYGKEI